MDALQQNILWQKNKTKTNKQKNSKKKKLPTQAHFSL
jgi:hypothetical protein